MRSPYKIVFFDNDGTLTDNRSTWVYTHTWLGTWEPDGRLLLENHLENRTPYDEFSRENVRLWKSFPKERFLKRIRTIKIRPGVGETVRSLKDAGVIVAVLSSGFSLWKKIWLEREGIEWDYYHANDIVFDSDGKCTGEIVMHVTDNVPGMDKGSWVERICTAEGIPKEQRVFVGDGWGDVSGFNACAFGIAVEPYMDEVIKAAKYILNGDEFLKIREICIGEQNERS